MDSEDKSFVILGISFLVFVLIIVLGAYHVDIEKARINAQQCEQCKTKILIKEKK